MINPFIKIRRSFRDLPNKKKYIEVITASLSIPVLLSVVLVNYLNIQDKRKNEKIPTPTVLQKTDKSPTIITIVRDPEPTATPDISLSPSPTTEPTGELDECIRGIGPITILSPQEGEQVSDNPFTLDVDYDQGDYCSVVWRYRIDGGNWSQFGDDDIVIYNLPSGSKKIELEVKSIVTNASKTITRTFTYQNTAQVSSPTPTYTPSVSPTP